MIRELGESIGDAILGGVGRASSRIQERKPLPADLLESDDAYLVIFDAPGATASDVQVRYDRNEVRVRIDRFRGFYDEFEMRFPGRGLSLDGEVRLPEEAEVAPDDATATLTSRGTLRIRLPKVESQGDEIDVVEDE